MLEDNGAIIVSDPFAGSDFASFISSSVRKEHLYGLETFAYDLSQYIKQSNIAPEIDSLASLVSYIGESPFDDEATALESIWNKVNVRLANGSRAMYSKPWSYLREQTLNSPLPVVTEALPELEDFNRVYDTYSAQFNAVMAKHNIDALFFPQSFRDMPNLHSEQDHGVSFPEITSPQINNLGLPAVTVPGGYYSNGSPFGVIFIGEKWSEAQLLSMAYAYEQATGHRMAPALNTATD